MKNNWFIENKPEILIALGLSGLTFSAIWNVRATAKAVRLIDAKKAELGVEKLTPKETFKTVWKCYIPSAASFVIGIPCVIASNVVSDKRNAALAAAYTVSETALAEYKEKTREIAGEKKFEEIEKAIKPSVIVTDGDTIFLDSISGRYFKSTMNAVQKAANDLNAKAIAGFGTVSLADWYRELNLDPTANSENVGWGVIDGSEGMLDLMFSGTITSDDKAAIEISYRTPPKEL